MSGYVLHELDITGRKYKPGTSFHCTVLIPQAAPDAELGLYIGHDGRNEADDKALLRLAQEGLAPYCVCIGVVAGTLPPAGGRNMRMDDYDLFTSEYADFLVYELIPRITEEFGLHISPSPDWHMTSGGSSGGISAFDVAWFHPEYFRRVYMSSPSFLAMGRGNEVPVLVRKYETKPIRVYEEYSENEPNDYFGSSFCAAKEIEMALEFAGYDFKCVYFPGEGHCSRRHDEEQAYDRLAWLWKDYAVSPVRAPKNSPRVSAVVPQGSAWEKTETFPEKAGVTLKVVSADKQMIYYGGDDTDVLMRAPVERPDAEYCHGTLHTLPRVSPKGAIDLAIDENDRLYALTAIGVQSVRSFGLIDVILDLPDRSAPVMLAFGAEDPDTLYLRTADGIYKRKMLSRAALGAATEPKHTSYYD